MEQGRLLGDAERSARRPRHPNDRYRFRPSTLRWGYPARLAAHLQQFHFEDQRGVGRDHPAGPALAVGQVGGDHQLALAAHLHARYPLIPAADHPATAQGKGEGPPAVAAVKFRAILEGAAVVDRDHLAADGFGAIADDEIGDAQAARGAAFLGGYQVGPEGAGLGQIAFLGGGGLSGLLAAAMSLTLGLQGTFAVLGAAGFVLGLQELVNRRGLRLKLRSV